MKLSGRIIVLLLIAIGLASLFVRLGFWQLGRRAERLEVNDAIALRGSQPPLDWTGSIPVDTTGSAWRRVTVRGRFDSQNEVVLRGRTHEGQPGVESLTPLLTESGALLVIRGWMPAADATRPDLTAAWPADWGDDPVELTGRLVPPAAGRAGEPITLELGGRDVLVLAGADPDVVADRLPYDVLPYVFRPARADATVATLIQPPPPEPDGGPHLSYALQWFAFATIAVVGSGILIRKESAT